MKISMIPYGLLSGFMDSKEIRIIEIGEDGFVFRIAEECPEPEQFRICFYDMKNFCYRKVEIREFKLEEVDGKNGCGYGKESNIFYREYLVKVEQKDYANEVLRLAGEYSRYIRLKLTGDDGELSKALTGYPSELDEIHCESLEQQKKLWFSQGGNVENLSEPEGRQECAGNDAKNSNPCGPEADPKKKELEFAVELNGTFMYEQYLTNSLTDFMAFYRQQNHLEHSWISDWMPGRLYIGNQFCHNLFPEEKQLFCIMDKMYSEGLAITLAFSYIREFMIPSVEKLLEKVDNWCQNHGEDVEIVVNDWAMAQILHGKYQYICPTFGTLLNKRKKDPRIKYKSGDTDLFENNSLNAGFYREFLAKEFNIHRYEWEACGYPQEFPPGKNSLHLPFYQTNTSQYCPLYALCTTGDRGKQHLADHCPGFCEKYALLYPEHLKMAGRYNSLMSVDKTLLEAPEMWKNIKGVKPDRIVINL